jgi:hypothetical protein
MSSRPASLCRTNKRVMPPLSSEIVSLADMKLTADLAARGRRSEARVPGAA